MSKLFDILETCDGDCCWRGPSVGVVNSTGRADGINGWPEKHGSVEGCAKRCEELPDCQFFHYYSSEYPDVAARDCYLHKGGVIGPELDDGRSRLAGVCPVKGRFLYRLENQ